MSTQYRDGTGDRSGHGHRNASATDANALGLIYALLVLLLGAARRPTAG